MRSTRAPAKLNLYLHITGRRPDGFHLLDSLAVFIDVADTLTVLQSDDILLDIAGPFAAQLTGDNLVLKAANALQEQYCIIQGAHIVLKKKIPVGAGLGGGSTDAAAVLTLLAAKWKIKEPLYDIAASLGSDVPACMAAKPVRMGNIGDELTPVTLIGELHLVLVHPCEPLMTADVYRAYANMAQSFSKPAALPEKLQAEDVPDILSSLGNDLDAAAISVQPKIGDILRAISATLDVKLARMTGSGAACFGLYKDAESATRAAEMLTAQHPEWWVRAAKSV